MKEAIVAWFCIALADIGLTWGCLPEPGLEANPISRWFLLQLGDWAYLVFLVIAIITASLLWRFKSYFISRVLLILLLLFQSQVVYHWVTGYVW